MPDLLTLLALAAFVLVFAGLTEGLVSRAPMSFPVIFLGLGFLLGEGGLKMLSVSPHSRTLEAVAVVTLSLVLFLDAVRMRFDRAPNEWFVPALVLGPGTIFCLLSAGGDGFLAAFAAGAAIAALDLELCDCFLEYGDATAEMIMLFAFILFGAVLSTLAGTVPLGASLALAAVTILVARPAAVAIVLRKAAISPSARMFIGWFGPRGLNSLLLALLVVQAGVPEGVTILAIAGIVVTASVILHGTTATPLTSWYARRVAEATLAEERVSTASGLLRNKQSDPRDIPRIEPRELARRLAGPDPPLVLDVRTRSSHAKDSGGIPGGVCVLPDAVEEWAARRKRDQAIVAYCT